ncbi:MAG: Superfamily I DNA and RNA helicase [Candidatus Berkelbacteria bacterium Licking1014_85]|uniref:Superfamily I DNA and RNA helicase n=1 Tax=Candidatus Berkelbacteria bacterium Licking1014_85 TaxID=2017148 RepID=A0A554LJX2_9BACT|nr:MAG: Superfamily I DNA and RNA helicase [Candidatus Berkelbacteria bacterium Licking1014_85]
MKILADLHLHSKFSRATSGEMKPAGIAEMAEKKGLQLVATGDFTHPVYFSQLQSELIEVQEGIYKYKNNQSPVFFILSTEISSIYSQNGKGYRIHNLVLMPNFASVEKLNERLSRIGNLTSDGRPILKLPSPDLVKIVLDIDERGLVIPAHIWTPWFSMFGSSSGFNAIEECFKDQTKYIYAYETGLSSDPAMNWRVSQLDNLALISNGDSHSLGNLMREATEFDLPLLTFSNIRRALINSSPNSLQIKNPPFSTPRVENGLGEEKEEKISKITQTIEFYPEEGKYHFDGHRACGITLKPSESIKNKNICPKCKRPLTIGVLNRVEQLADRAEGGRPENIVPFQSLVPLETVIAEALGTSRNSVKVKAEYENLVNELKNEYYILSEANFAEIEKVAGSAIAQYVIASRNGELDIFPGYDGVFGIVKIKPKQNNKIEQEVLF